MKDILDKDVSFLDLDNSILDKLYKSNIKTVKDLWNKSSKDLKTLKFTSKEIKNISIKMELNAIDLNNKKY